ncbi:MAG: lytic transglycosylase domain-containing protein [Flavobacteriales bacterium]
MKIIKLLSIGLVLLASCSNEKEDVNVIVPKELLHPDSAESYQDYINAHYQVFAIPIPKDLNFAGENVPLDNLFVRENLDREILVNTYWHSNTFLYQKRAKRWFPQIEKLLAENGVPDDLKYLALVESGLDNVRSPAGAAGFWQFMPATARGRGLEVNQYVDERYNLEKSTKAACEYLKGAYKQFGSWSLAAASYNMGKGGVNNQLTKQKVESYYDLDLNNETSRYVYRILAAKLILSNSDNFGFKLRNQDYYSPYRTYSVSVDSSISDLAQYALDQGTNYATLRHLNPWLRGYSLPNSGNKTYILKFPKGDFHIDEFVEVSDSTKKDSTTQKIVSESAEGTIKEIDSLIETIPNNTEEVNGESN